MAPPSAFPIPSRSKAVAGPPSAAKIEIVQDFILEGLGFQSMTDREDEVSAAHRETFDWIYRDHSEKPDAATSIFPSWLSTNNHGFLYWINGKAGSGKSTLLRYITEHPTTRQLLKTWSGGKDATTAAFYFWTSGSLVQRSQTGLLRSLLFQLLTKHRDLIADALPQRWRALIKATTQERIKYQLNWTLEELTTALTLFPSKAAATAKVCLFIDGLDEFDGDHPTIIDFFRNIANNSDGNVKICLSSRPWPVFEAAFSRGPTLKLQDLTFNDMKGYASDKLLKDPRIRRIIKLLPEVGEAISTEVIQKADGVFLYLILAVRFLVTSLDTTTNVDGLKHLLQQLPADLDDLFAYTLFSIQSDLARENASKIFQLIRACEVVADFTNDTSSSAFLTLWDIALATDSAFATISDSRQRIAEVPQELLTKYCTSSSALINSSCAGLLTTHSKGQSKDAGLRFSNSSDNSTAHQLANSKVTFLHRTIRDWLVLPETWQRILFLTIDSKYDAHLRLLMVAILRFQFPLEYFEAHRRLTEWWPSIVLGLTHARHVSPEFTPGSELARNVTSFDEVISQWWVSRKGDHWARSAFGAYEEREKHATPIHKPFLALCVKFNLIAYLDELLRHPTSRSALVHEFDETYVGGSPLLAYAVELLCSRRQSIFPFSSPEMVKLLLSHSDLKGVGSPNSAYNDFSGKMETPWKKAIDLVREGVRRKWILPGEKDISGITRWTDIMVLMIEAEADVGLVIPETKFDPETTALDIIKEALLASSEDARVAKVQAQMLKRARKGKERTGRYRA